MARWSLALLIMGAGSDTFMKETVHLTASSWPQWGVMASMIPSLAQSW